MTFYKTNETWLVHLCLSFTYIFCFITPCLNKDISAYVKDKMLNIRKYCLQPHF